MRKIFTALLLALCVALCAACEPVGGDQSPGVSACPILSGQSTWTQPDSVNPSVDSGLPIAALSVLSAQTAQMTKSGGTFTLNMELRDANGGLLYDGLSAQSFTIDTSTPLVLREPEGVALSTQVGASTEGVDVQKPGAAGLTGVLVFDSSYSTSSTDEDRLRVSAGQLFVNTVNAGTQLALMDFGVSTGLFGDDIVSDCFNDSRLLSDFTDDKKALATAISRVTAAGATPMYGAIEDALSLGEAVHALGAQNPFLIVFTDGSATDYEEQRATDAITRAKTLGAAIHTVALSPAASPEDTSDEDDLDLLNLQRLSAETGGIFFTADKAEQLPDYFNALANVSNTGVSVVGRFRLTFSPDVEPKLYVLQGNVIAKVNGGTASAPFRLLIDLRRVLY